MSKILQITLFILVINSIAFTQSKWRQLDSVTNVNLKKVCFVDTLNGWIGGEAGTVLYTSNGGKNWESRNVPTNWILRDIFFLNHNNGWALYDSAVGINIISVLYYTSDKGASWQTYSSSFDNKLLNSVCFVDSLTGFLTSRLGTILKTEDAGVSWKECKILDHPQAYFEKNDIKFYNKQNGFVCGGNTDMGGIWWVTNDCGETWSTHSVTMEPINGLCIIDSANVIGIGGDPEGNLNFCKTTDGGSFWTYKNLVFFGMGLTIGARTKNEFWACQNGMNAILSTTDAGENWKSNTLPGYKTLSDVIFVDSCKGFAAGRGGVIFKYDSNYPVGVGREIKNEKFILHQNYPNPFNPSTTISFNLEHSQNVKLFIYNMLGQKICTLIDKYCASGVNSLTFKGDGLPSGNYYYVLLSDNFIEAKKMQLLK